MYTLQAFKEDTIANVGGISDSDTSLTLNTGNFGTPTGAQLLVLDYDVPASREIVIATINGTAVTSMTRAQDGTSAVAHAQNAKVMMAFVPSHYAALTNGTGFATGSTSVGIPAAAIKQEAWTAYTPTVGATGSMTYTTSVKQCSYIQIGKTVHARIHLEGTTGGTASYGITATLPVLPILNGTDRVIGGSCHIIDGASDLVGGYHWDGINGRLEIRKYDSSNWGIGANRQVGILISYEAA